MRAAGSPLPSDGAVYIAVRDEDKEPIVPIARRLAEFGIRIYATRGTASFLKERGVEVTTVYRISERQSPDALGLMRRGGDQLVKKNPAGPGGGPPGGELEGPPCGGRDNPFIPATHAARGPGRGVA